MDDIGWSVRQRTMYGKAYGLDSEPYKVPQKDPYVDPEYWLRRARESLAEAERLLWLKSNP